MRTKLLTCCAVLAVLGCGGDSSSTADEQKAVEGVIIRFHRALEAAYQGKNVDLAAEFDRTFDANGRYVTYWGTEEPVDTTRERMLNGVGRVQGYTNAVENVESRVYGGGAVVTCIVRQEYKLEGHPVDEFLPTTYVLERREQGWKVVFVHRSADFQTIQQQLQLTKQ